MTKKCSNCGNVQRSKMSGKLLCGDGTRCTGNYVCDRWQRYVSSPEFFKLCDEHYEKLKEYRAGAYDIKFPPKFKTNYRKADEDDY